MMINQKELGTKFKEHYERTRTVATHIFVYSKHQDKTSISYPYFSKRENYVHGKRYTECRARDSDDLKFVDDAKFVDVGCYSDVTNKEI